MEDPATANSGVMLVDTQDASCLGSHVLAAAGVENRDVVLLFCADVAAAAQPAASENSILVRISSQ